MDILKEFSQRKLSREFGDIIQKELDNSPVNVSETEVKFYEVLDKLNSVFTSVCLLEYQNFFSDLLGRKVTQDEIKLVLKSYFEEMDSKGFVTFE